MPAIAACRPYDLVFANILAGPLMRLAAPMARLLAPGATVILSGLLHAQANALLAAYRAQGFFLVRRERLDGFRTSVSGFKIGLEIFVRSKPRRLAEVGYLFVGRSVGVSKITFAEAQGFGGDLD